MISLSGSDISIGFSERRLNKAWRKSEKLQKSPQIKNQVLSRNHLLKWNQIHVTDKLIFRVSMSDLQILISQLVSQKHALEKHGENTKIHEQTSKIK